MPNAFNFQASPFDCLNSKEQRLVRDNVDVVYFREGETILKVGITPSHLFIIIKGFVSQLEIDSDEVVATYNADDCFDGRALVTGRVSSRFIAAQEVIAYQLAKETVHDLISSNATFGALLFSDLSQKLSALSEHNRPNELPSLTASRVDQAFVRPPCFVDGETDILSVVRLFQEQKSTSVIVKDKRPLSNNNQHQHKLNHQHNLDNQNQQNNQNQQKERLGIFRRTQLQTAILDGRPLNELAVQELASFPLFTVSASDTLGEAMTMMLGKRIHCLVVLNNDSKKSASIKGNQAISCEDIKGTIEALDLFSYLSQQSHLLTIQIEEAKTLNDLSHAALQITQMMAAQQRGGLRVDLIASLVQQLNARLFERAWGLIAPPDLIENSCLFVMGSEGRGEQLLKTDQDNGLIWRDAYSPPENLADICQAFSDALTSFGYPKCLGEIMVSNPAWRHNLGDFSRITRQWLAMPTPETLMNLAIFMDAHAICGDAQLLAHLHADLGAYARGNDVLLSRFTAAIDAFGTVGGWWNRILGLKESDQELHLKKIGIFPLVHGVRSLALANGVRATSTTERIQALVASEHLSPEMGADLTQSLHFFMALKLKTGLLDLERNQASSDLIHLNHLSSLDRDLLKDTLAIVKRFKTFLRQRFHLSAG